MLVQGRGSFVTEATSFAASNETALEAELQKIWTAYHGPDKPLPSRSENQNGGLLPVDVDYAERMVVAHFAGERQDVCQGVQIEQVTPTTHEDEPAVSVDVTVFEVASAEVDCESSSPMQVVSVPQMAGPLAVNEEKATYEQAPEGWKDEFSPDRSSEEASSGQHVDEEADTGKQRAFEMLDRGGDSNITDRSEHVVRDEQAWAQLWANHTAEDRQRPTVDFEDRMVVAVFHGPANDGCHGVEVEEINTDGDGGLRVHVHEHVRDDGACIQQITHPFHIVELDRTEQPVTFEWHEAES